MSSIPTFALLLTIATTPAGYAAQQNPPNIIVVFCDDMGYADIGPFGAQGFKTPNVDRMAAQGMVFTDFYVGRSVCTPSRAALMTGSYPHRVGAAKNFHPSSEDGLSPDAATIAEIVKSRGYATAIFGKWHLGHQPGFLPTDRGFDEFFGLPYSNDMWPLHPEQGELYNFPDLPLMEGQRILKAAIEPEDQVGLTSRFTERAVRFIETHKNRPFLLYLPYTMPHVPLYASDRFAGMTRRGPYGDVIAEIDWGVGRILDTLKGNGLDERTLVIFTSDNGPWLLYGDHGGSAGPLREGKATAFEGGFRVPCVMRWPGRIPAGSVCREVAAPIDILPTIAAMIGAELPARPIDGLDIGPLMRGEVGARSPHEAYYYYLGYKLTAVRSGRWKLVFPHTYNRPDAPGKDGRPGTRGKAEIGLSLFDLEADQGESLDVASKHPEVVKRLQALADKASADPEDRG
jgi:arylsulfatase A-like enzyme